MATSSSIPKQHLQEVYEESSSSCYSSSTQSNNNNSQKNNHSKQQCSAASYNERTTTTIPLHKNYVNPLSVENGCTCPHLEAHLPTFLDSGGFGLSSLLCNDSVSSSSDVYPINMFKDHKIKGSNKKARTISDVHFECLFQNYNNSDNDDDGGIHNCNSLDPVENDNETKISHKDIKDLNKLSNLYPFGEEEMKTDLVSSGGVALYYNPLFTKRFLQHVQNQRMLTMKMHKKKNNTEQRGNVNSATNHTNGPAAVTATTQETYEEKLTNLINQRNELFSNHRSMLENSKAKNKKPVNTKKRSRSDINVISNVTPTTSEVSSGEVGVKLDPVISSSKGDNKNVPNYNSTLHQTRNASNHGHLNNFTSSQVLKDVIRNQERNVHNALTKVEHWLELIQQNRTKYWERSKHPEQNAKSKSLRREFGCFDPKKNITTDFTCTYCTRIDEKRCSQGKRKRSSKRNIFDGDGLMQCLDCAKIGCGSPYVNNSNIYTSKQHINQHFLLSGHSLGMTCGPKGSIYCFKCGDFVYHPVLEREKERVAILHNAEWLGWERNGTTRRSFGFSHHPQDDFVFIPDTPDLTNDNDSMNSKNNTNSGVMEPMKIPTGMVVWRGFRALYPTEVPSVLIEAGKRTLRRIQIFHGQTLDVSMLQLSNEAAKVASLEESNLKPICSPIGLYNMGNTCYLGCVLQCMMNLPPIQKYFLRDVKHDHKSCQVVRSFLSKSTRTKDGKMRVCIGCEMDKLCLAHFGSVNGIDGIHKAFDPISSKATMASKTIQKGMPISPTEILAELWQCKSMSLLVGYEQRDAHEFLQMFLDILSRDCRLFHEEIARIRWVNYQGRLINSFKMKQQLFDGDIVSDLFGGALRSVLICEKCGFKRSQKEPFLNISIPLDKELTCEPNGATFVKENESSSRRPRSLRNQIDLLACLHKFVSPESLSDPLHCQWCKEKTKTLKQHTFAKFPKVLCLHLKRFDAAKNRKIDEPVSYPMELNMGQYYPQWREIAQKDVFQKKHLILDTKPYINDKCTYPEVLYDLFGTIDHSGSLYQGHYTSSVKIANRWYHCNDSFVSDTSREEVLGSKEVYMLFYVLR